MPETGGCFFIGFVRKDGRFLCFGLLTCFFCCYMPCCIAGFGMGCTVRIQFRERKRELVLKTIGGLNPIFKMGRFIVHITLIRSFFLHGVWLAV